MDKRMNLNWNEHRKLVQQQINAARWSTLEVNYGYLWVVPHKKVAFQVHFEVKARLKTCPLITNNNAQIELAPTLYNSTTHHR